jgi:hypothetical protein
MKNAPIPHLLVVAGPSCVGKSTFLARLASGDLPTAVRSSLPERATSWPQVEAWELSRWLASRPAGEEVDGIAVHYDLWRLRNPHIPRPDPELAALTAARAVTVVTLTSHRARLVSQLARRMRWLTGRPRSDRLVVFLATVIHPRVALLTLTMTIAAVLPRRAADGMLQWRLVERLWGDFGASIWHRHAVEAFAAYLRPGWLSGLEQDWLRLLNATLPAGSTIIELEPSIASRVGPFEWQVRTSTQAAARA